MYVLSPHTLPYIWINMRVPIGTMQARSYVPTRISSGTAFPLACEIMGMLRMRLLYLYKVVSIHCDDAKPQRALLPRNALRQLEQGNREGRLRHALA